MVPASSRPSMPCAGTPSRPSKPHQARRRQRRQRQQRTPPSLQLPAQSQLQFPRQLANSNARRSRTGVCWGWFALIMTCSCGHDRWRPCTALPMLPLYCLRRAMLPCTRHQEKALIFPSFGASARPGTFCTATVRVGAVASRFADATGPSPAGGRTSSTVTGSASRRRRTGAPSRSCTRGSASWNASGRTSSAAWSCCRRCSRRPPCLLQRADAPSADRHQPRLQGCLHAVLRRTCDVNGVAQVVAHVRHPWV